MKAWIFCIVNKIWLLPLMHCLNCFVISKHNNSLPLGRDKSSSPVNCCAAGTILIVLPLINTTAYHWADTSFHLLLAVALPAEAQKHVYFQNEVGCYLYVKRWIERWFQLASNFSNFEFWCTSFRESATTRIGLKYDRITWNFAF